ncbi:hypothetical protein [Hoeflea sp.]|uniref:hypothetical protein n=1 Tax=Hoeflea sp. TaxID=1940281 RepID=UPI003A8FCC45
MRALQFTLAGAAFMLAALIVYALMDGSFTAAGAWLTSEPWGLVTLADLYLGFVLAAILIGLCEPRPVVALLWILPIPFLGNIWTVIWFIIRLPHLRERLARR